MNNVVVCFQATKGMKKALPATIMTSQIIMFKKGLTSAVSRFHIKIGPSADTMQISAAATACLCLLSYRSKLSLQTKLRGGNRAIDFHERPHVRWHPSHGCCSKVASRQPMRRFFVSTMAAVSHPADYCRDRSQVTRVQSSRPFLWQTWSIVAIDQRDSADSTAFSLFSFDSFEILFSLVSYSALLISFFVFPPN
jgi:hypothetical protein